MFPLRESFPGLVREYSLPEISPFFHPTLQPTFFSEKSISLHHGSSLGFASTFPQTGPPPSQNFFFSVEFRQALFLRRPPSSDQEGHLFFFFFIRLTTSLASCPRPARLDQFLSIYPSLKAIICPGSVRRHRFSTFFFRPEAGFLCAIFSASHLTIAVPGRDQHFSPLFENQRGFHLFLPRKEDSFLSSRSPPSSILGSRQESPLAAAFFPETFFFSLY